MIDERSGEICRHLIGQGRGGQIDELKFQQCDRALRDARFQFGTGVHTPAQRDSQRLEIFRREGDIARRGGGRQHRIRGGIRMIGRHRHLGSGDTLSRQFGPGKDGCPRLPVQRERFLSGDIERHIIRPLPDKQLRLPHDLPIHCDSGFLRADLIVIIVQTDMNDQAFPTADIEGGGAIIRVIALLRAGTPVGIENLSGNGDFGVLILPLSGGEQTLIEGLFLHCRGGARPARGGDAEQ